VALVHPAEEGLAGVVIVVDLDAGLARYVLVTRPMYWTTRLRPEIGKARKSVEHGMVETLPEVGVGGEQQDRASAALSTSTIAALRFSAGRPALDHESIEMGSISLTVLLPVDQ
jgi:hypothetical protein